MFSSYSIPEWLHFGKSCPTGQLQDQQQEILNKKVKKKVNKQNKTPLDDGWMMYFYYILPCSPKQTNIKKLYTKTRRV